METKVPKGRYVLAVSGGVDSMVLLDIMAKKPELELVVAHFDHGIRSKLVAAKEKKSVAFEARKHGLKFIVGRGDLGVGASEETARKARYAFLDKVKKKYKADAVVTAHHQDDLIETALINTLRGTGRRGLSAIATNADIKRPLLDIPKEELIKYAIKNKLAWSEDVTNSDTSYLRNYLRKALLPSLKAGDRDKLVINIQNVAKNQDKLEELIATLSQKIEKEGVINRQKFNTLPVEIANELAAYWLRKGGLTEYERRTIESVVTALKTAQPETSHNIKGQYRLYLTKDTAQISNTV